MATAGGANIAVDGLVFGYDTGYPLVSGNLDTYKFNRGEPTINLTTNTPYSAGWGGTYTLLDSSTKSFEFTVNNFNATPGAGWRSFLWDCTAYSGSQMTITADVETIDEPNGDFSFLLIGHTSGSTTYLGYSPAIYRNEKYSTAAETVSWSGEVGYGTRIGFTLWFDNGTPGVDASIRVSNIQIEVKPHPTPFTTGTRSVSGSLIDLTRTTDIDLSNVSFDSNAQMTFDGTDDYIAIPNSTKLNPTNITLSAWINFSNSFTSKQIFGKRTETGVGAYWLYFIGNTSMYFDTYAVGSQQRMTVTFNSALQLNTWYNITATYDGTTKKVYLNGNLITTNSSDSGNLTSSTSDLYIGRDSITSRYLVNGKIPIAKVYNRALTPQEVLQNYNALKERFSL